jgi:phosphoribosylaminoimidazolecarboxamide formyltransferase/IMP cyclohydrolase
MKKMKSALISVSNKDGLLPLAYFLQEQGVEMISTGGTGEFLRKNKIPFTPIEQVTGKPEAFDGRMKTISFEVLSGILYKRDNPEHEKQRQELKLPSIDMVVVNFYPFEENPQIETIDIGGPNMLRAAAKNFQDVSILSKPEQYESVIREMQELGTTSLETRKQLAKEAFVRMAEYDLAIANYFMEAPLEKLQVQKDLLHSEARNLRYGENPHQKAVFYAYNNKNMNTQKESVSKSLSYNNFLDMNAAWNITLDLQEWIDHHSLQSQTAVIIKHTNPCGVATHTNQTTALEMAWQSDPVSAFGSIIAFNSRVEKETAEFLKEKFIEVVLAPAFSEEARQILADKKQIRLCQSSLKRNTSAQITSTEYGFLWQENDHSTQQDWKNATQTEFPKKHLRTAEFSNLVSKHLKSNAITLAKRHDTNSFQLIGAGMGQPNRIDCLEKLAVPRAKQYFGEDLIFSDLVLASDAFFPFADVVEKAAGYGIQMIVQPGGSIRDKEILQKADELKIAIVFTGIRHFKH